jgi:protein gp37
MHCRIAENVPFFFKQWGGKNKKVSGRILDGTTWDQMAITVKDNSLLSEVA